MAMTKRKKPPTIDSMIRRLCKTHIGAIVALRPAAGGGFLATVFVEIGGKRRGVMASKYGHSVRSAIVNVYRALSTTTKEAPNAQ